MKRGFTLIELLVVVLIIGILAAIALPQYQKAVERSRMAEAIQVLGNFAQAQSIYYMQHNVFAENINEGDITLSEPGDAFEYEMDGDGRAMVILMARRASGMYEGGLLGIGVQADGTILKACDGPEGFCPMAEPAGYEFLPGELGYGEGNNNGGNGGRPDPGTIIINPGTITCDTQPECAPPSVPVGCFCRYPTSS